MLLTLGRNRSTSEPPPAPGPVLLRRGPAGLGRIPPAVLYSSRNVGSGRVHEKCLRQPHNFGSLNMTDLL